MFTDHDHHNASSLTSRIRAGALALCALTATTLTSTTAHATDPEFTPYQGTTYGRASGDVSLPGFGLILELVGGDTPSPRLRLFGGIPGNHASILISGTPTEADDGQGNITLVAGQPALISGRFDGRGRFEMPLEDLDGGTYYAQGTQTGAITIDPTDGPVFELSNGLGFAPRTGPDTTLELTDFLPHLPTDRVPELSAALLTSDIEQAMRTALNSTGDAVTLKLELSGNAGAGANGGGKTEVEVEIKRTAGSRYELTLAREAAVTAGIEAVEGVEANAAVGFGAKMVFRFESIEGCLYGVKGVALALMFPRLAPGKALMESGVVADGFMAAQTLVNELQARQQLARQQVEQARALLTSLMNGSLADARSGRDRAYANYLRAYYAYHGSYWKTWNLLYDLGRTYAAYAAANVRHAATLVLCNAAQLALTIAEAAEEFVRQLVRDAAQELARLGRIAWTIIQMRPYATDHFIGTEICLNGSIDAEATVGIPGVSLPGVGLGVSGEVKKEQKIRWEYAREGRPLHITISRQFEVKGQVKAGAGIAAELTSKMSVELEDVFSIDGNAWPLHTESKATLGSNLDVAGYIPVPVGPAISMKRALGRNWSVSMAQGDLLILLARASLPSLLIDPQGAIETIAGTSVEFTLQDRLETGFVGKLGISAGGNGGKLGGSLIWKDQGRKLQVETTIGDAVENLSNDALEMVAPLAGAAIDILN